MVSLLITTLHNRWMSGAMIAVSRCLYVVKSDIFDKVFARFNGKLLATGIWIISILHIIPVFLEVILFQKLLFFHQLTQKMTSENTSFIHNYMRTQNHFESGFKSPFRKVQNKFALFLFYLILTFRSVDLNPDSNQLCALIMYRKEVSGRSAIIFWVSWASEKV